MRRAIFVIGVFLVLALTASLALAAYEHAGEKDSPNFTAVYSDKARTKLDSCNLCHSGGQTVDSTGKTTTYGSCQWCHYKYGYNGSGDITATLNPYGKDYLANGRNEAAIRAIEPLDSDGDGYTNKAEIDAISFPGDPNDNPSKTVAPSRVYTRAQLQTMPQHTQFLLLNTSRRGDFYGEYSGVVMQDLLADAGILPSATGIIVYSPDGFSATHPLEPVSDPVLYHVNGIYPEAPYYYDPQADQALNTADGWCDYSAPSCKGRNNGDAIKNPDGLKMILALKLEGAYLQPGVLDSTNKLNGEGPFRVVPPQKAPSPPDQSSTAKNQNVVWPYNSTWDHNAGFSTRSATIIKVEPLPAGTTDINTLEAGWNYIDQDKIIIYGAIDGSDSNGNGILDSEEGTNRSDDMDGDGIPDFEDTDTASLNEPYGSEKIHIHTSKADLAHVKAMTVEDPAVPQTGKPGDMTFPYGLTKFDIAGLANGETVTVTLAFPGAIPTSAKYYKVDAANGWHEVPFGHNDGDNTITLTLTDGDPATDADGVANGVISDPGVVALASGGGNTAPIDSGGSGGGGCFISAVK